MKNHMIKQARGKLATSKKNLQEKLIEPTKEDIRDFESWVGAMGFDIDDVGKTWMGRTHYQVKSKMGGNDDADFDVFVKRLENLEDKMDAKDIPMTYNVGLNDEGWVTAGIDLFKKRVATTESLKESWEGEDAVNDLVERAKSWIDDGEDLDDAVLAALDDGLIYTSTIRALAEHYGVLPSDDELVNLFYEELYGDVYNAVSDYYDEAREAEEDEEDEDFEEDLNSKALVEKRGRKFVWDEDELKIELPELKEVFEKEGAEKLTEISFAEIKERYPEFAKWFGRYHEGMEGDDAGNLDENSIPVADYWAELDDVDFKALFDYVENRGANIPVICYMRYTDMPSSYEDEIDQ